MKRQIRKKILYHSLISKSKYEQAVQGLFTTGTSEVCLLMGWPKKEKVSSKRGLKSIHHHSSRSGNSTV